MQAADNYSDFVEERSAGVIVVLAEQKGEERKEDSTFTISRHRAVDEHARSSACHTHTYICKHAHTGIKY